MIHIDTVFIGDIQARNGNIATLYYDANWFLTRKLCYRKDDRAMHPVYERPENFRDSPTTPTAIFP